MWSLTFYNVFLDRISSVFNALYHKSLFFFLYPTLYGSINIWLRHLLWTFRARKLILMWVLGLYETKVVHSMMYRSTLYLAIAGWTLQEAFILLSFAFVCPIIFLFEVSMNRDWVLLGFSHSVFISFNFLMPVTSNLANLIFIALACTFFAMVGDPLLSLCVFLSWHNISGTDQRIFIKNTSWGIEKKKRIPTHYIKTCRY